MDATSNTGALAGFCANKAPAANARQTVIAAKDLFDMDGFLLTASFLFGQGTGLMLPNCYRR
jgi:hypothetical protein